MKHRSTQATYRPIVRPLYTSPTTPSPVEIELKDLPEMGGVRIVNQGEANTYLVTEDGVLRYFKM